MLESQNRGGEVEVNIKKNILGQVPVKRAQQKSIITTIDNQIKIKQNQRRYRIPSALGTPDKYQAAGDMLYPQKWYLTANYKPKLSGQQTKGFKRNLWNQSLQPVSCSNK